MRTDNWEQPYGTMFLYEGLRMTLPFLRNADYPEPVICRFGYNRYNNEPSYELVVVYGGLEVFACIYVLDRRFHTLLDQREVTRIRNLLASYAMSHIMSVGLLYCIESAKEGELTSFIVPEQDDKEFLSLH